MYAIHKMRFTLTGIALIGRKEAFKIVRMIVLRKTPSAVELRVEWCCPEPMSFVYEILRRGRWGYGI